MSLFARDTVMDDNSEMVLRTLYKKYGSEYYPFFAAIEPAVQSLQDVSSTRAAMQAITRASNSIQIFLGDRGRPATEEEIGDLHSSIHEVDKYIQWAVRRSREDIAFSRAVAMAEKTTRVSLPALATAHKGAIRVTDGMRRRGTPQHGPLYQRAMRSMKEQFMYSALGPLGMVGMIAVEGIGGAIRRGRQRKEEARAASALSGLTGSPRMAGYHPDEDMSSSRHRSRRYNRGGATEDDTETRSRRKYTEKETAGERSRRKYTEEEEPWYKRGFKGFWGGAKKETAGEQTDTAGLSKFFQEDAFKVKWTKDVYKALVTEGTGKKSFMDTIKDGLLFAEMAIKIAVIAGAVIWLKDKWDVMFPTKKQTPEQKAAGFKAFGDVSRVGAGLLAAQIATTPLLPGVVKLIAGGAVLGVGAALGAGMDLAGKSPRFAQFLGKTGGAFYTGYRRQQSDPRNASEYASSPYGQWLRQSQGKDRKNEMTQVGTSNADWQNFIKMQYAVPGSMDRSQAAVPVIVKNEQKFDIEPLAKAINTFTSSMEQWQRNQNKSVSIPNDGDRRGIDDRMVESVAGADMGWDR